MATERARSQSLAITQEILAEALGVGLGAINFTLQDLEKRGVIQRTRSQITVIKRGRLRSAACRCYPDMKRGKKYVIKTHSL
jgi:DNA-binding MarR family transcriptional regulator